MKKNGLFLLVGFVIGCVAGSFVAFGWAIAKKEQDVWKSYSLVKVGEFLDTDVLYLPNGETMRGRVVTEDKEKVVFSTLKGTINFKREEVEKIEYNYYTRYVKELW